MARSSVPDYPTTLRAAALSLATDCRPPGSALTEIGHRGEICVRQLRRNRQYTETIGCKRPSRLEIALLPIGYPSDLKVGLRPRRELDGVRLTGCEAVGLHASAIAACAAIQPPHRKPVGSRREIAEKVDSRRDVGDGCVIREDRRSCRFDIAIRRT